MAICQNQTPLLTLKYDVERPFSKNLIVENEVQTIVVRLEFFLVDFYLCPNGYQRKSF
jgi:hypothetical protein